MINNYSSFLSGCAALALIVTLITSAVSVRSKIAFRSHLFTNLMSPNFLDWIHNV